MKIKTIHSVGFVMLALSLASLACAVGAEPTPPPQPFTPVAAVTVSAPTLVVEPTVALPPTPEPNATAISIPGPTVTYNHITLTLDINLARGVGAQISPATPPGTDLPFWALRPDYTEFTFDGYPVTDRPARAATLSVFSVEKLQAIAAEYGPALDQLKTLINNQAPDPTADDIPDLPFINAGSVYVAKVHYIATASVKGIALITHYSQFPGAITNRNAIYIFEGFTTDEGHYILAHLPVNAPVLGFADNDFGSFTVDPSSSDYTTQYQTYLDAKVAEINALTSDQFAPNLASLDALVGSVAVTP